MKTWRDWPAGTVLVRRASPLVVSMSGFVSLGQMEGETPRLLVARIWMLDRRLESIGVPLTVLTTSWSWVLFRNCGASSLSAGLDGTETSRLIPPLVLRA